MPDALIMGEDDGYPVEGFDLTNSPSALIGQDLTGKTLIHRSTAGTQGVVRSSNARRIFATGLCNIGAIVRRTLNLSPESITLIETGVFPDGWGDEDVACADLIEAQLCRENLDIDQIKHRVRESKSGRHYSDPTNQVFPPSDLGLALDIDRYDFTMEVEINDGLHLLRPSY